MTSPRWIRWTAALAVAVSAGAAAFVSPAAAAPRIRNAVMLQPADLGGAPTGPLESGFAFPLSPQPCPDGGTGSRPLATRSLSARYLDGRYHIVEYVARYRADGAHEFVVDLLDQLDRCSAGGDEAGYQLLAAGHMGPDTVLMIHSDEDGDQNAAYFVGVAGDYLVVVLETAGQLGSGDATVANGIGAAAVQRAASA